jgi:cbb3-type cytochrome oxidase subunit 3
MIQNVARDLGGSPLFGVISVCLFFIVFAGALAFAALQRKSHLDRMSALPLDDGEKAKGESHE